MTWFDCLYHYNSCSLAISGLHSSESLLPHTRDNSSKALVAKCWEIGKSTRFAFQSLQLFVCIMTFTNNPLLQSTHLLPLWPLACQRLNLNSAHSVQQQRAAKWAPRMETPRLNCYLPACCTRTKDSPVGYSCCQIFYFRLIGVCTWRWLSKIPVL